MECKAQALWHKVDSNCMSEEWHILFGLLELQQFAIPPLVQDHSMLSDAAIACTQAKPTSGCKKALVQNM